MIGAGELAEAISKQIVAAMKAHDPERTGTLRLIKTALQNKAIEKVAPLTKQESEQVLASMIKQRRDSIEQFNKGNRPELAAKEAAEIVVIEEFVLDLYLKNTYFLNDRTKDMYFQRFARPLRTMREYIVMH